MTEIQNNTLNYLSEMFAEYQFTMTIADSNVLQIIINNYLYYSTNGTRPQEYYIKKCINQAKKILSRIKQPKIKIEKPVPTKMAPKNVPMFFDKPVFEIDDLLSFSVDMSESIQSDNKQFDDLII